MTKPRPTPNIAHPSQSFAAKRVLARQAAEAGEGMRAIGARLNIPRSTLTKWARADGFRASDIAARRAAESDAQSKADAIRAEAEAKLAEATEHAPPKGEWEDDTPDEAAMALDRARARVGALLENGMVKEAEADMRAARRLQNLSKFAAPVQERIATITSAIDQYQIREGLIRIALQVCEAWKPEMSPPDHMSSRITSMFQHRLIIIRDILMALYEVEASLELIATIFGWAEEGWFVGFRPKVRNILPELYDRGHHALITRIQDWLEADGREIVRCAESDKQMGYALAVM